MQTEEVWPETVNSIKYGYIEYNENFYFIFCSWGKYVDLPVLDFLIPKVGGGDEHEESDVIVLFNTVGLWQLILDGTF